MKYQQMRIRNLVFPLFSLIFFLLFAGFSHADESPTGSLEVTITPLSAVFEGARWRVDGGDWHASGDILSDLSVGTHLVDFMSLDGWKKPNAKAATIVENEVHQTYATYVRQSTVPTPDFSPAPGTYTQPQTVTISCSESDATIRYTTNGTEPTEDSTAYASPITISSTILIKAKAFKTGWADSATTSGTYTINGTVAAPTFYPSPGTYTTQVTVSLSTDTPDATIRYTTDGTTPTANSTAYSGSISITTSTTIIAKAFKADLVSSDTSTGVYIVEIPVVNSGGFYYEAYLAANADLPRNWGETECITHYKLFGFWEKRPTRFNLEEYLNANPDLPANWTLEETLNHYNLFGKYENRPFAFDAQEYLSLYPDLPQDWSYDQAYSHYINYGKNEERVPSFDETAYLEMYSDLPSEWDQAEAFAHYSLFGRTEGRVYDPYDEDVFLME